MNSAPWTARDWCDAIVARDWEQLEWMANNAKALSVINDYFSHNYKLVTPLMWAISIPLCPLERIQFLVERAGAQATAEALEQAMGRWKVAAYLHRQGARHVEFASFFTHFSHLVTTYPDSVGVEFMYEYPQFWEALYNVDINGPCWVYIAKKRRKAAHQAILAVLALAKRGVVNKDMAQMMAKRVEGSKHLQEWGAFTRMDSVKSRLSFSSPFDIFTLLLSLITIVVVALSMRMFIIGPDPSRNCTTVTCPLPFGALGGPAGPKGPDGICISEGVGIIVPGASHGVEITIDNTRLSSTLGFCNVTKGFFTTHDDKG